MPYTPPLMPLLRSPRVQLAFWLLLPPVLIGTLLRIALCAAYRPDDSSIAALFLCLGVGLLLDLLTACAACAPLFAGLALLPAALLRRAWLRNAFLSCYGGALVFHAITQWFFFDEFGARFNHVALDYLIYPTEVFTNIGESYDVPLYLGLSAAGGAGLAFLAARALRGLEPQELRFPARLRALGAIALLALAGGGLLWALPAQWREDRVENELARNGTLGLLRAFATATLDWHQYYPSLSAACRPPRRRTPRACRPRSWSCSRRASAAISSACSAIRRSGSRPVSTAGRRRACC